MRVFTILLFVLFIVGFSGKMKSQETQFKGKRYTFQVNDSKNPAFSSSDLIRDMSALEGVFKCKYLGDKKIFIIYATRNIQQVAVHQQLMKHQLGYSNFDEQVIKVNNIEADAYETK
jgi:hypothetical protein